MKFRRTITSFATAVSLGVLSQVVPFGVDGTVANAITTSSGTADCEQTYTLTSGTPAVTAYQSGATCFISFKNNSGSFHTGTSNKATLTWTVPSGVQNAKVLVVGGGGGGGAHVGAGGGAGGLQNSTSQSISSSTVAIEIGSGGRGAFTAESSWDVPTSGYSYSGEASKFGSLIADGGGRGAFWSNVTDDGTAGSGGSGGGAVVRDSGTISGGAASGNGAGYAGGGAGGGGSPQARGYITGGGGGAGGPGQAADHINTKSGDGGVGVEVSWLTTTVADALSIGDTSSSSTFFSGGGGGGFHDPNTGGTEPTPGAGGNGGGGDGIGRTTALAYSGTRVSVIAESGGAATGGGGGGAGAASGGQYYSQGGNGGSGVVVVSYTIPATPTISSAPADNSINAGQTASFSVTSSISDAGTLSYQWQQSTDSGSTWSNISGATSASFTTSSVLDATDSGDQFRVVVRNTLSGNYAETTSSAATVTVSRLSQTVTWSQPTSLVLADSGDATTATTSGDGSISYSLVSAGTTGCSINSSTGALTFSGTGTCSVKADAAQTNSYNAASTSVTVTISQGTIAISGPSSKVGTSSSSFTNVCTSSCDVSGFADADEVLVVVNKSDGSALSGEVKLTSTTGLTQSITGYQSNATVTGLHEIAFEGTPDEVNAALETLQYKSPSGGGDETIGISASLSGAAYFSANGHYYEAVTSPTESWEDARDAAAASTFNGLTGYLVTITSDEENAFVYQKTGVNTWIGASDNYLEVNAAAGTSFANQSAAEGSWYWVTGPEAGTQFWSGNSSGSAVSSRYENWSSGEPNDYPNAGTDGEEDYGHLIGSSGLWNDYPENLALAYVIEYGGNGGTVLKQASTTFDVGAPTAPLQVSGVSVSAGNAQLTVSWTAPGTGGAAITDYVIEQSADGGTTWTTLSDGTSTSTSYTVTGLTNGSSYSFRVSAKNAIGTGTASSSASGTPAVPAATSTSRNNDDDEPVVTPVVTPNVTRPTVRLPFPTPTPSRPTVLSSPVKTPTSVSSPVDRLVSRIGGVPAPVTTSTNGDDELSVSTSSLKLSLKMSQQSSVSETSDANAELTIKPGARAAVTATGLLPNTTLQVWLPNVSERELGRLSVNAAGEIQGELGLSSSFGEDPLPVGRQTLQMTGYDADGNQTVVEMPVNIAQGPPTPEPNRQEGALPELGTGQSLATSAGVPTPTTVTVLDEQNAVSVTGDGWGINMNIPAVSGTVEDENGQPVIRLVQSSVASMSGSGMQPGTVASVWFFSEPTLMGTVAVAEDGSFTLDVMVDAQFIPAGNHTVQVQGVGTDGYIKSVNTGVLVEEPAAQTTASSAMVMLWWALAAAAVIALLIVIIVSRRRRQA